MIKTTGIPSKLGFTSVPVIFEYPLKDTDIFSIIGSFWAKNFNLGNYFEPIVGFVIDPQLPSASAYSPLLIEDKSLYSKSM